MKGKTVFEEGLELEESTISYRQDRHCCSGNEDDGFIKLSIHDGGGGKFLVLDCTGFSIDEDEFDGFCEFLKSHLPKGE